LRGRSDVTPAFANRRAARVGIAYLRRRYVVPAPAFPVFADRGYDPADYPEANRMLDSSLVICEARYPIFLQSTELIEQYAATIRSVMADPERFLGSAATPPPVPA